MSGVVLHLLLAYLRRGDGALVVSSLLLRRRGARLDSARACPGACVSRPWAGARLAAEGAPYVLGYTRLRAR